jgi:hypothetical protein
VLSAAEIYRPRNGKRCNFAKCDAGRPHIHSYQAVRSSAPTVFLVGIPVLPIGPTYSSTYLKSEQWRAVTRDVSTVPQGDTVSVKGEPTEEHTRILPLTVAILEAK